MFCGKTGSSSTLVGSANANVCDSFISLNQGCQNYLVHRPHHGIFAFSSNPDKLSEDMKSVLVFPMLCINTHYKYSTRLAFSFCHKIPPVTLTQKIHLYYYSVPKRVGNLWIVHTNYNTTSYKLDSTWKLVYTRGP